MGKMEKGGMKKGKMKERLSLILAVMFVLAGFLGLPAQIGAAASAEELGALAVRAAWNQHALYQSPMSVGSSYGDFSAYDGYVLKNAGADLTLWKQGDVSLDSQLRALMDQTLQDPAAVSAKEAAYEFLAARAMGDAGREAALLQILVDRQGPEEGFDGNLYNDAPAFEALARAGVLDRIQAAAAYEYLLRNWDEGTGAWPQGYVDLMTTAQTLRALNGLSAYAPEVGDERIDAGMAWLQACQQADGSFLNGEWDDPLVDTAEVLMTLADFGLPLDAWNQNGVSGVDYITDSALSEGGSFGSMGNAADNTAALEALGRMGAVVDWNQAVVPAAPGSPDGGGNGGDGNGNSGGNPDTVAVFLEITGPSGRVLYARNTVHIGAADPNPLEALKQSGLSYRLKGNNYVEEVAGYAPSGQNGWMYRVNGASPVNSILDHRLEEGDSVLWFYSEDPSNIAGVGSGDSGGGSAAAPTPTPTPTPTPAPSLTPTPTPAVARDDYATRIVIKIEGTEAQVNGETRSLDVPAYIIQGRTLAPLRFISEAMGAKISWLDASKEVVIERGEGFVQAAPQEAAASAAARQIVNLYRNREELSLWEGMILASQNVAAPQNVTDALLEEIRREQGEYRLATDYAKAILYLKSIGQDPKNAGGYNLVEKLYSMGDIDRQGVNGLLWALNALESEAIPEDAAWTRERLVETVLTYQNQDGGFPLSKGADSDVDVTAMVMAALAGKEQTEAAPRAMEYLLGAQSEDGEFLNLDVKNSGSVSQVVLTLSKLGVNPLDTRFVKQGKTLIDVLLSYQAEDGRFRHTRDGQGNDMATEQAAQALIQYGKFAAEQNGPRIVLKVQRMSLNPDMTPVIVAGRVLVPVRYVTEKLGAEVQWDQAAQTVTITKR